VAVTSESISVADSPIYVQTNVVFSLPILPLFLSPLVSANFSFFFFALKPTSSPSPSYLVFDDSVSSFWTLNEARALYSFVSSPAAYSGSESIEFADDPSSTQWGCIFLALLSLFLSLSLIPSLYPSLLLFSLS
jgi:hypothetical protein